jgi:hypothetical protein
MPVVTPANAYLVGLAKQINEATVPATAAYSLPVFSSDLAPRFDLRRIEVTDAASIEGDPYKSPSWWQADAIEFPAFDDSLGTVLVGMWPTDTATGVAPTRNHAFSGLGGVQPWMAFYSHWTDAGINYEQTFGKGLITGLTFSGSAEGGPLRISVAALGQEVTGATTAAFPATVADLLSAGWFGLQLTNAKIELDIDTPNVNPSVSVTNVRSYSLNVSRNASPEPTATGMTVTNLSQGKLANTGTLEVLWDAVALDTYRASFFGSAAGTSFSSTIVRGALELTFRHSVSADSQFILYIPAVMFQAAAAVPNPDGSALAQTITLAVFKPMSGDHVQPTLINNVTAAY